MAQYQAGTADYLAVIVLQAALLQAQRLEIDILTRRLTASVLLIEALEWWMGRIAAAVVLKSR